MKVIRKQTIDTETFELGDEIRFNLTTGEEVSAKAVQKCEDGMLFITNGCIEKEMPMYKNIPKNYSDYAHSDLRKYLNSELLSIFPEEIRRRMLPVVITMTIDGFYGDYIRIPTEKELFGENAYGEEEPYTAQFYGMKDYHNRVALEHTHGKGEGQWYWLQNRVSGDAFLFVNSDGNEACIHASRYNGVRLVFNLSVGE